MSDPETTTAPTRGRIYRSRTDRMIGGVAGGLAEYLRVDPVLIRLLFVLFAFVAAGVVVYIVAWIIIPERPLPEEAVEAAQKAAEAAISATTPTAVGDRPHGAVWQARVIVGSILILMGSIFLADNIFPSFNFHAYFWPIGFIALGGVLILHETRR